MPSKSQQGSHASVLAEMLTASHASGAPLGMIKGPKRALSSPHDAQVDAFFTLRCNATVGVSVVGVAAIDDDVAFSQ